MMANKHASLAAHDDQEYNPLDNYGVDSHADDETYTRAHPPATSADQVPEKEKSSRNSWEENDSDEEPYPADTYDYGDAYGDDYDDEDEDEYEERPNRSLKDHQAEKTNYPAAKMTFDQDSDPENDTTQPPNPNLFRASLTNTRASVNSGKSYSSHTKHHSFGYDEDRPEPSESESEDSTESESDGEDAYENALTSPPAPPAPPISSGSPSVPSMGSRSRLGSHSGSPTLARSANAYTSESPPSEIKENQVKEQPLRPADESAPASSEAVLQPDTDAPLSPVTMKRPPTVPIDEASQKSPSTSNSPSDQALPRPSDSESDASTSSGDMRTPSLKGHISRNSSQRPGMLNRTLSSTSSSRGFANGYQDQQNSRHLSYSDLSDAELNEVSLDEPVSQTTAAKRVSVISGSTIATPRAPAAPTGSGFPSSFFGGRPHPKSQQYQQQPNSDSASPSPAATASVTSTPSAPPDRPPIVRSASTSISSIASSIQGAFMGRGFGGSGSTQPLHRTPSRTSQRESNTGMRISTSGSGGVDLRSTNSISPERASTYSVMTTDSNMDLLLSRLDAQNSMLEQDTKKADVEMDRALGHAKEESESTGEDIDWDYWGALMHDYNGVVKKNPKQLTQMIQKGVPPALRGLIWQLLAKSKDGQLEATYAELLKSTSSHEKQIQRDMSRTFPNHEYFQAEGLGQEALFNVVKAYSLHDPEVGYCQGLSFVVGPLLLNMPDEEAFCVLVRMMSSYEMRGHFTPDMNMLQLRLYQYEQLMEETVPLVYKHFQNQGIRSTMYASQWFMTLFAYKFPLDLVFRVYDILFVEGVESLLRFAIALLKANHDQILNHDFETLIEFLKNGLFEPYKNDASKFVQDAYSVKVTPKKLTQYAQKYTAMIQRQQAELAAEESLRESNRQLSMHVRRLEGSLHTLNKEHVDLAKELIARKLEMAQLQDQNDVLTQKVSDLTKIVDSQAKEVEDRFKEEIRSVMEKNVELVRKNEEAADQCSFLEGLLIDTKMKYAESENERDALTRKLSDLRKALGLYRRTLTTIMDFLKSAAAAYQQHNNKDDDEDEPTKVKSVEDPDVKQANEAHNKVYQQGNSQGASEDELGKAAAVQAFNEYEKQDESAKSGGEGGQAQLVQMAMAEVQKLMSGGGGEGGAQKDKSEVLKSAMGMAMKLIMSKAGGSGSGGDSGGLASLLQNSQLQSAMQNPQIQGMLSNFMKK
ncbi:GTPase-activating protein [Mortierella alpina]|nr:GTPase-activating protein [Mortierella alpina]